MSKAAIIQANYEQLVEIAQRFADHEQQAARMAARLSRWRGSINGS